MWLLDFMRGRYGFDELGRQLGILTIVLIIVSIALGVIATLIFDITSFVRAGALLNILSIFVNWAAIALMIWMFFRVLSRNTEKRRAENERFLRRKAKRRGREKSGGKTGEARNARSTPNAQDIFRDRAAYDYLTCPFCGQKMRVPKGRGKIAVKCPSCGEKTIINS